MIGLSTSLVRGGGVPADYALEFNGTDEYLTRALPTDQAGFNPANTNGDWQKYGSFTLDSNVTTELGSSKCIRINATQSNHGIYKTSIITVGKKYKFKIRYKSTVDIRVGNSKVFNAYSSLYLSSTSQWNTVEKTFTAVTDNQLWITATGAGTILIDTVTITEDWKLDLNESYELIKHSMNRDFERTLGSDLIGTLNFNDEWSGTNTTYPSNTSFTNSVNGYGPYKAILTIGKKYVLSIAGSTTDASGLKIVNANGDTTPLILDLPTGSFNKEIEFLAVGTYVYLRNTSTGTTTITSFTVKEIPNLVTNGTFDSSTGWNLGTGWAYGSDKVTHTAGTAAAVSQTPLAITRTRRFRTVYTVSGMTTGSIYIQLSGGGGGNGTLRTANGTYSQDIVAGTASQGALYFLCSADFDGSIDNIHIYEIPEWTASGNHTGNISILDKAGSTGTQSYKITASGAGDSTTNRVILPSANIESCVAGKKYTLQLESRLDASSLSYDITNKVKDGDFSATTYWTISNPTDFNITGGVAVKSGLPSGVIYQGTSADVTYTAGKVYKVILTVSGLTGSVEVDVNGGTQTAYLNTEATHTVYIIAGTNTALGLRIIGGANTLFTIDNISSYEATPITLTASLGGKSVTSSALSIVSGTFTKTVLNFEATSAEKSKDLILYLSGAGSVFVDNVSLTQAYDSQTYLKIKPTETAKRTVYNIDSKNFLEFRSDGKIGVSVSDGTVTVTNIAEVAYTPNEWIELIIELSRTGNVKIIKGTGTPTGTAITTVGKIIKTSTASGFRIGANDSGTETFKGQIAKIVRTLYDNVTGFVNPDEVLRVTFQNGSNITECLKDYSPKGHTVSGVNMDITNRKRVTA